MFDNNFLKCVILLALLSLWNFLSSFWRVLQNLVKLKLHFRPQQTSKLWKTPKNPEIITNHFYNKNMIIDSEWDLEQIGLRTTRDWFCCVSSNMYTTDYLRSRTQDLVGKTDKLSDFWKSILVHNWRLDPDPCLNCGGDTSQPYWKKAVT